VARTTPHNSFAAQRLADCCARRQDGLFFGDLSEDDRIERVTDKEAAVPHRIKNRSDRCKQAALFCDDEYTEQSHNPAPFLFGDPSGRGVIEYHYGILCVIQSA
jgi:hypothetical protein